MALGVLFLVYTVLWICVQTEDTVKHVWCFVVVVCVPGALASIIYTFPLIANEVDL